MITFWTDDRVAELRLLVSRGLSASEISRHFGGAVTRNAVIGKAYRIKCLFPPKGLHKTNGPDDPVPPGVSVHDTTLRAKVIRARARKRVTAVEPPPVVEPIVTKPVVVERRPQRLRRLLELENNQCRWPFDQDDGTRLFCGDPCRDDATPYCAEHHSLAYRRRQPTSLNDYGGHNGER